MREGQPIPGPGVACGYTGCFGNSTPRWLRMSKPIVQLLANASPAVLSALVDSVDTEGALLALSRSAVSSSDRKVVQSLIDECRKSGYDFPRGVAEGIRVAQAGSPIRLVISAPTCPDGRQTAGVISELLGTSKSTIALCSYVLLHFDALLPALTLAGERGVQVRVLLDEAANSPLPSSDTLASLRSQLIPGSVRFWRGDSRQPGSLHAKFVVVDDATALITSANMTGRAMVGNVEVGVLTSDLDTIRSLSELFGHLWAASSMLESTRSS